MSLAKSQIRQKLKINFSFQLLLTAIKLGLQGLLQIVNAELTRNKTIADYYQKRDGDDANYYLEITIPALIGKYLIN